MTATTIVTILRTALFCIAGLLMVTGCASRWPVDDAEDANALLISDESIVAVDGEAPVSPYRIEIAPGQHVITVAYRTYTQAIRCTFEFESAPGERYEIIERSNPEPLSLYRSKRSNWLWITRHDAVAPVECVS
jgi:hypothetical protein